MSASRHDVCADPLPLALRRWVDEAAQAVIADMNKPLTEGKPSRTIGSDGLTDLGRMALRLMQDGKDDKAVSEALGCSRAYAWAMRRRFEDEDRLMWDY